MTCRIPAGLEPSVGILDGDRFEGIADSDLVAAGKYGSQVVPDEETLRPVLREQRKLAKKMVELQPFIDSEVKLKTELIGKTPPDAGESGTLGSLVKEYMTAYAAMHDSATERTEQARKVLQDVLASDDFQALKVLEKITALRPAISGQLAEHLTNIAEAIFVCPSPSRSSVEEQLKRNPQHECDLSFQTAVGLIAQADEQATKGHPKQEKTLDGHPVIRLTLQSRIERYDVPRQSGTGRVNRGFRR